jgi:hypothetical protein
MNCTKTQAKQLAIKCLAPIQYQDHVKKKLIQQQVGMIHVRFHPNT